MKSVAVCVCIVLAWATAPPVVGHGSCGTSFFSALVQLMPCRPAVAPFSPTPPSEMCCNAVRTLGQPCLCAIANGPPITGVDRNVALQLPVKCTTNFEPCDTM